MVSTYVIQSPDTGELKFVRSFSNMTIEDICKAVSVYDRYRIMRNRPRKAIWARDKETLQRAYKRGVISKSTYYRRLKLFKS